MAVITGGKRELGHRRGPGRGGGFLGRAGFQLHPWPHPGGRWRLGGALQRAVVPAGYPVVRRVSAAGESSPKGK